MPDDTQFPRDGAPVETPADLAAPADAAPAAPAAREEKRRPILTPWQVVGGVFGGLVLLLVLFLLLFDWDWLRGPIGRFASARAHREVRIDGHLRVHLLTWTPRIRVERLYVGQPDWAKAARAKPFATVESVTFDVKLMPLFAGRIESPLLEVRRPDLVLYQDAKRANWEFSDPEKKTAGKPFKLPPIQQIVIADGKLDLESIPRKARLTATINTRERLNGGGGMDAFTLVGRGSINRNAFSLDVGGGPLINVRKDRPYPFRADVRAGATHITARGQVPKPFDLGHVTTAFTVTGDDLNDIHDLTGLALPNSPPYRVAGNLTRDGKLYDVKGLTGRVGASDIGGHVSVDTGLKRPLLRAQLASRSLDFADLAAIFGAPGVSKAATGEQKAAVKKVTAGGGRLLPDATLKVDQIRAMDAEVTYKAAQVKASPSLPLRAVSLGVKLDDGLLKLNPITLTLPQGQLNGTAALNARGRTPVTDVDIRLSNVELQNYIPPVGGSRPVDGVLAARARLHGSGDSVHKAAASSDGQVTALIPRGHIRKAFAELLGINAANGLFLLLNKDKHEADIRCAVADFRVTNGVMQAERITIDTSVAIVNGEGRINLADESLGLTFKGKPTKFRIGRFNVPIVIGGKLNAPSFGVRPQGAVVQAGAAAGLGFLFPPLAIVPFLGLPAKSADCGALAAEARTGDAPISAAQTRGPAPRSAVVTSRGK